MPKSRSRVPTAPPLAQINESKLLEIGAYIVEKTLSEHGAIDLKTVYDSLVPERDTGTYRQVDAYISFTQAGRPYARAVEVRNRSKPAGPDWCNDALKRGEHLGVHRTTLVSASGFTSGAISRARAEPDRLDLVNFRRANVSDWPYDGPVIDRLGFENPSWELPLTARVYEDAVSKRPVKIVSLGIDRQGRLPGVFVALWDTWKHEPGMDTKVVAVFIPTVPGIPMPVELAVDWKMADGSITQVSAWGKPTLLGGSVHGATKVTADTI